MGGISVRAGGRPAGAVRHADPARRRAGLLTVRDVSLFVDVIGHGYPVVFLHGGPSADHWTLLPAFRPLADRLTLVFYDHRCNGR